MVELASLTLQAVITFLSSMAGMAVYVYFWCPNHRCCQFKNMRTCLEKDRSYYEHPNQKDRLEENYNG